MAALPAVTFLQMINMHVGDAGASEIAAALGRGALPRLENLRLYNAAIGDAGLVALAPALQRLSALEILNLGYNPLGDEGLAALVAPPPPAGALPPPTGVLTKLKELHLDGTQVTDASCAALIAALDRGALPDLKQVDNPFMKIAVHAALGRRLLNQKVLEAQLCRLAVGYRERRPLVQTFAVTCPRRSRTGQEVPGVARRPTQDGHRSPWIGPFLDAARAVARPSSVQL